MHVAEGAADYWTRFPWDGRCRAPPDAYLSPITKQLMIDPVCTADGHTFERAAIERWLAQRHTSPLTGLRLPSAQLTPNLLMRSLLRELEAASK